MAIPFQKAEFLLSAASPSAFVRDGRKQLAFAGRSNVGKSSVINCLTERKNLARVGEKAYLVDLPGYGYARVSKGERDRWGRLMEAYFASGLIHCGVMIVDARHKPTADDVTMANWFFDTGCPVIVVANKLDKLKKSEVEPNLALIRQTLGLREEDRLVPFSAEKGIGRESLRQMLEQMIEEDAGI